MVAERSPRTPAVQLPKLQLGTPLGFPRRLKEPPGLLDGRVVASRYQQPYVRPAQTHAHSNAFLADVQRVQRSPRRVALEPLAPLNPDKETQPAKSLDPPEEALMRKKIVVAQHSAEKHDHFSNSNTHVDGLDFEEFKEYFRSRLGATPACNIFDGTPERDKRNWFKCALLSLTLTPLD